ncbi:MAG: hypothetical protein AAFX87_03730 [Bacteroidota bacterium]
MKNNRSQIVDFNEGTSQRARYPRALRPEYAPVDEKDVYDLMQFAAKYSGLINYFEFKPAKKAKANGKEKEAQADLPDWKSFFADQEIIMLSGILNYDIGSAEDKFNSDLYAIEIDNYLQSKIQSLDTVLTFLSNTVTELSGWQQNLKLNEDQDNMLAGLDLLIEGSLNGLLGQILSYIKDIEDKYDFADFSAFKKMVKEKLKRSPWKIKEPEDANLFGGSAESAQCIDDKLLPVLQELFLNLSKFINGLVQASKRFIDHRLKSYQGNEPHIGLFVAFLQLFKYAQDQINAITGLHLKHHYREILKQSPKASEPDTAYVLLGLAKTLDYFTLKKGTQLSAGKNASTAEIIYETTRDVALSHCEVKDIKTAFMARNEDVYTGWIPGGNQSYFASSENEYLVSGIYSNRQVKLAEDSSEESEDGFPVFGQDQFYKYDSQRNMESATIGFAISTPTLLLNEGERSVTIKIDFDRRSFKTTRILLARIFLGDRGHHRKPSEVGKKGLLYAFQRHFANPFDLWYTSDDGLIEIDKYRLSLNVDKPAMEISFYLPHSAKPFTGYNAEIHGNNFSTAWPLLQVLLKEETSIFPYSIFKSLQVENINVQVVARNVRNLILYNDLGQLTIDKPFQPFGTVPYKGSYLLISNKELLAKQVTDLKFRFEWLDLPAHDNGFKDHYVSYNLGTDNDAFEIKISYLKDRSWSPAPASQQVFNLFESQAATDEDGQPINPLCISTDLEDIKLSPLQLAPIELPDEMTYSSLTGEGFFKLQLSSPPYAFAHDEYTKILSRTILENSKREEADQLPEPYLPYTPTASSLTLDYCAEQDIKPAAPQEGGTENRQLKFFHISAFGTRQVLEGTTIERKPLLPNYGYQGLLYLGLANLKPPQQVSLLFTFSRSPEYENQASIPEPEWNYLSNNEWKSLDRESIVLDTTNKFTQTGIIELNLPEDITDNNPIMSSPLFWLAVGIKENANLTSRCTGISPNAVTAVWKKDIADSDHLKNPLPPEAISKILDKIPQVKSLVQPLPSFGGEPRETIKKFHTRLSERLSHKKRALNTWDYERLVLEKFPEVYKVKCITASDVVDVDHFDDETIVPPGEVRIVVIPDISKIKTGSKLKPKFNVAKLEEIGNYINELTSNFVKVRVINPFYERVRVALKVKFNVFGNIGPYITQLHDEMTTFLAPWLSDELEEEKFGGSIYKSDVVGFIENRPYVDFVTAISLIKISRSKKTGYSYSETTSLEGDSDIEKLDAMHPHSVLTSARSHMIEVQDDKMHESAESRCIGNMELGSDFIIG